ncbi:MAG: type II toxin-antitoxin system HicB family antitoxin [Candidatus Methanomethyliales bacterium]|nr:type II toxin-antitoxin system HicB family antitoxin [Candidatus Methanomethylicales archaeon]
MAQKMLLEPDSTVARPLDVDFGLSEVKVDPRCCYRVVLKKGLDGWIVAKCVDIKGAVSQGKSVQEALKNIIEAISAILEDVYGEVQEFSIFVREEK